MKKYFFTLLMFGVSFLLAAQTSEVGLTAGVSYYMGDLNPSPIWGSPRPAGGVLYKYNATPHWSLRGSLLYGYLTDDDKNHADNYYIEQRALNFRTYILEATGIVEFNLLRYSPGLLRNRFTNVKRATHKHWKSVHNWTPYLFAGIGAFSFNPKGYYKNSDGDKVWTELRPLSTEGEGMKYYDNEPYSRVQIVFPVGIGAKARFGKSLQLGIEWSFRFTLTDYLDDVSKTYPDPVDLIAYKGELAAQMSSPNGQIGLRGDVDNNDYYSYLGITATWILPPNVMKIFKTKCK